MNNHEEYNDCKTQLEQIYKIKVNGMKLMRMVRATSTKNNPQNSF